MQLLNNLLVHENLILKERAFGIEKSLKKLITEFSQDVVELEKTKVLFTIIRTLEEENESLNTKISTLEYKLAFTIHIADEREKICQLSIKDKDSLISKLKEKQKQSESLLNLLNSQNNDLKESLFKASRDLDLLSKEYEFSRRKLSILEPSSGEKICKNCKKQYSDDNNLNWSCKTHKSLYSGEVWWCCGKTSKEDEGCNLSMHQEERSKDRNNRAYSKLFCTSCKERGHNITNCPKDPNIKNGADANIEIDRLNMLVAEKLKKRTSINTLNESLNRGIKDHKKKNKIVMDFNNGELPGFLDINDLRKSATNKIIHNRSKVMSLPDENSYNEDSIFPNEAYIREAPGSFLLSNSVDT